MAPKKEAEVMEEVLSVLPPSRPAQIFLMEFIVDDLQMFKLPGDVIDSDPANVEFRFLDSVFVSIDDSEICSAVRSNGKNCLFTLSERPSAATPVRIVVLKGPQRDPPIPIGYGEMVIDKPFENLFRMSLPEDDDDEDLVGEVGLCCLKSTEPINSSRGSKHTIGSKGTAASKSCDGTAPASSFPVSQVYKAWHQLQASPLSKSTTSVLSKSREYGGTVGVICVRLRITCFGQTIVSPFQYNKRKQSCAIRNDKFTIDCDQIFMPVVPSSKPCRTPCTRSDVCESCLRRSTGGRLDSRQSRSGRRTMAQNRSSELFRLCSTFLLYICLIFVYIVWQLK